MRRPLLYISILCFFFHSMLVLPQKRELTFKNYSITDGLAHNAVHCITQDDKGFLWIGTEDGLNMFDGYSFTTFKSSPEDPYSISDNFINCFYIDNESNLWIGTNNNGINRYDKNTGRFESLNSYEQNGKTLPFKMVYSITGDSRGHLWIGTFSGLFEVDPVTKEILSQHHQNDSPDGLPYEEIRCLYMDDNDILWIGMNEEGLSRFDIRNKTFRHFRHDEKDRKSVSDKSVSAILRDRSGILWIGTGWGLNIMDETTGTFKHFVHETGNQNSISNNIIFSLLEDHMDNLWVATLNGLNMYDRKNDRFMNWRYIPTVHQTISDNYIFSLFEDKYRQVWFGTGTKGIDKFNNQIKGFKYHFINIHNQKDAANNTIREIYEADNNELWLGILGGGLNIYNPGSLKQRSFRHNPGDPASLSDDRVNSVFRDSRGNIWIGTWGGGLNRAVATGNTYRFEHYTHNPADQSSISSDIVKEVTEDYLGRLWLGTEGGLDLFNPVTKRSEHFVHDDSNPNSLADNRLQSGCIIFDSDHNMWAGTWGGLSKVIMSPATNKPERFINYKSDNRSDISLSDNRIIALNLAGNNILWAGTFGGGLMKMFLNEKGEIESIKTYNEKSGLSNNVVYNILIDEQGLLWMSTNNGLSRFDPVTEKFENYDVDDGLQSNQFYWGAACKVRSGEMYFGGINGLNSFIPEEIIPDKIEPDIAITDFRIFNRKPDISPESELHKNIIYADTVHLNYDDNVISFEFSALQFAEPEKNQYAYKLERFNDEWVYTEANKRFAIYTNLDPGEYIFKVKGSNADGIWSKDEASLRIIITPPFWQRWWFRIIVMLCAVTALLALYQWRVKDLYKQKNRLEKTVMEKTAEIVHRNEELLAVNTEFAIANKELERQREELENTLRSLKDAQNKLVQSEKMASLGVLAAGVAHEINNPLNFIRWGIEGIQAFINEEMKDKADSVTPLISSIQDGIRRASDIVSSLNHYSRKDDLPATEVDVRSVLESCLVMLNSQLKERIKVKKNYPEYPIRVLCNQGRLHQVFLNILTNAIHSITGKGTIIIDIEKNKEHCLISITDNGCGMSKEIISKITDPFFTTKEPGKGTGLGLSITYNILQDYNGTIEFKSEENKGTTVMVTFPLTKTRE